MGVRVVDTATLLTLDRTQGIDGGAGATRSATYYVELTAIIRTTGTLNITLRLAVPSGNINIAQVTGLTTGGTFEIPLLVPFTEVNKAIPEPEEVFWDLIGDTTNVSGRIFKIIA